MIVLGLTGSIASGKSEVSNIFRKLGYRVFDADTEVHRVYADGSAAQALTSVAAQAIDGLAVDRGVLSKMIAKNPELLPKIETAIHPLIRNRREQFLNAARAAKEKVVILDIPLLFETQSDRDVDATLLVIAPDSLREQRALARPGMTKEKLAFISARQWPQEKKRKLATFTIENDESLAHLEEETKKIIARVLTELKVIKPHA